ncbi:hypothetical protein TrVE_jg13833 [Triparma verrucosa]|uniref:Uncharacterized protein n=1 Tax=Triparma verrucosa TaxID=1606542 RepID=A0A9W7KWB4_9STRA|nr:hypothetical protein TrVE_jg13833 [Triparma verrucosa]
MPTDSSVGGVEYQGLLSDVALNIGSPSIVKPPDLSPLIILLGKLQSVASSEEERVSITSGLRGDTVFVDDADCAKPKCYLPFISGAILMECSTLVNSQNDDNDLREALKEAYIKGMRSARDVEESMAKKRIADNPFSILCEINASFQRGVDGSEQLSDAVLPALVVMQSRQTNPSSFENLPAHTKMTTEALQAWSLRVEATPPVSWGVPFALATGDTRFLAQYCAKAELARCEFDYVCSLDNMEWVVEAGFEEYFTCRQAAYKGGVVVGANLVDFSDRTITAKLGQVSEGKVLVVHETDSCPFNFSQPRPDVANSSLGFRVSLTEQVATPEVVRESDDWWSEERNSLKRNCIPDAALEKDGSVRVNFGLYASDLSEETIDPILVVLSAVAVCPSRELSNFRNWVSKSENSVKIFMMVKVVLGRIVETISKSVTRMLPLGGKIGPAVFTSNFFKGGRRRESETESVRAVDWDEDLESLNVGEKGLKECLSTYRDVVKMMEGVILTLKGEDTIVFALNGLAPSFENNPNNSRGLVPVGHVMVRVIMDLAEIHTGMARTRGLVLDLLMAELVKGG